MWAETLKAMAKNLFWRHDPPPILGGIVPHDRPQRLARKTDELVQKTEELENELRRYGIISRR
jgi:hypothetical protein